MTKTIRIPDDDYDKIRQYADKRDIPMSAALSQYLNVIEEFRTQLHRESPDDGQPTGVSQVDDWEAPLEGEDNQAHKAPAHEEDLGPDVASLQDQVEALEAELTHLQETVQTLHSEEDYRDAHPEHQ